MREILFRGKRMDNGEWVEGSYIPEINGCHATILLGAQNGFGIYVDPATVGQFTGLMANGKRIFEGDVVRIEHEDYSFDGETIEHRVEEGFIDYDGSGTIGLVVEQYNGGNVRSPFFHILALTDQVKDWSIEVIGNIHDHELLEVTPDE